MSFSVGGSEGGEERAGFIGFNGERREGGETRERGKEEETEVCDLWNKHLHCDDSVVIHLVSKKFN